MIDLLNQFQRVFLLVWIPCLIFILLNCFAFYGQPHMKTVKGVIEYQIPSVYGWDVVVFPLLIGVFVTVMLLFFMKEEKVEVVKYGKNKKVKE